MYAVIPAAPALRDAALRLSKTFSWLDLDDFLTCLVAHLAALAHHLTERLSLLMYIGLRRASDSRNTVFDVFIWVGLSVR